MDVEAAKDFIQAKIKEVLAGYVGFTVTAQTKSEIKAVIARELGMLAKDLEPKAKFFVDVQQGKEPTAIEYSLIPENKTGHAFLKRLGIPHVWPQYEHDCDGCTFLGVYEGEKNYDLYFCIQGAPVPTVVARYSDNKSGFLSGLSGADWSLPLAEAKRLAEKRGFLAVHRDENL